MAIELESMGYMVKDRAYNAKAVVPQNRLRLFTLAFKDFGAAFRFEWPMLPQIYPVLKNSMEFEGVPEKYFLKEKTWNYLKRKQEDARHNHGYNLAVLDGQAATLPSRYGNDGHQCLIPELKQIGEIGEGRLGERIYDINGPAITQKASSSHYAKTGLYFVPSLGPIHGKPVKLASFNTGRRGQVIYDINAPAIALTAGNGIDGGANSRTGLYAVPTKPIKIGAAGNSQGQQVFSVDGISPTLCSGGSGHLGGWNGLYAVHEIIEIKSKYYYQDYTRVRRLMPRECARVMGLPDTYKIPLSKGGFPDDYTIEGSDTQAYKQLGNAVVPAVVERIAGAALEDI